MKIKRRSEILKIILRQKFFRKLKKINLLLQIKEKYIKYNYKKMSQNNTNKYHIKKNKEQTYSNISDNLINSWIEHIDQKGQLTNVRMRTALQLTRKLLENVVKSEPTTVYPSININTSIIYGHRIGGLIINLINKFWSNNKINSVPKLVN